MSVRQAVLTWRCCLLLLWSCGSQLPAVAASRVRNIYWNTTTASLADQPQTVLVNEGNLPWEYDQVNIICPVYRGEKAAAGGSSNPAERHIIYSVEREEFESCRVTNPRPRIVAVCNRPQTFMYFTITFRSFTPTPGGLEFRPGQDYYFISTSNAKDIHRRVGGWCSSHNMKMIFRVAENTAASETAENSSTGRPVPVPTPAAFWSKYYNSARVPDDKENYVVQQQQSYRQTGRETYFNSAAAAGYGHHSTTVYHPRRMDKTVDIRITANALSSSASGGAAVVASRSVVTAMIVALLTTLLAV